MATGVTRCAFESLWLGRFPPSCDFQGLLFALLKQFQEITFSPSRGEKGAPHKGRRSYSAASWYASSGGQVQTRFRSP